ncbi:MAG: ribonuclease H-like domain-containing protein [Planctomycetota bacterium]
MVAPDRDRLRRALGRRGPAAGTGERAAAWRAGEHGGESAFELRELLQRHLARPRPVVELPPGEEVETAAGTYWRRLLRYPLDQRHGDVELGRGLRLDGARLAELARDPSFADQDPRQCLFFDTETTGLAGGAGTVVFNIGLGWFEDDALVVEQTFLRDFSEEPALLLAFAERLRERPVPVSFVGKSFDRHRIAARLAIHKQRAPILTPRHLDLYHLARRAFRGELPDCRLRTVEQHKLGLRRTDDLPGSEAPIAFLSWLRDRSGEVDRVLEHNRLDVLSVAALLGVLAGR